MTERCEAPDEGLLALSCQLFVIPSECVGEGSQVLCGPEGCTWAQPLEIGMWVSWKVPDETTQGPEQWHNGSHLADPCSIVGIP